VRVRYEMEVIVSGRRVLNADDIACARIAGRRVGQPGTGAMLHGRVRFGEAVPRPNPGDGPTILVNDGEKDDVLLWARGVGNNYGQVDRQTLARLWGVMCQGRGGAAKSDSRQRVEWQEDGRCKSTCWMRCGQSPST
jgi:hypothetical protein